MIRIKELELKGGRYSVSIIDGDKLKARIKELGLNMSRVAKRCNCADITVAKAVRGRPIRIDIAEAMIRLLGITAAEYGEVKNITYCRVEKFRFNPAKLKAAFVETGLSQSVFADRAGV